MSTRSLSQGDTAALDWVCPHCTSTNVSTSLECDTCALERPRQPITVVEVQAAQSHHHHHHHHRHKEGESKASLAPDTPSSTQDTAASTIDSGGRKRSGSDTGSSCQLGDSDRDSDLDDLIDDEQRETAAALERASAVLGRALSSGNLDDIPTPVQASQSSSRRSLVSPNEGDVVEASIQSSTPPQQRHSAQQGIENKEATAVDATRGRAESMKDTSPELSAQLTHDTTIASQWIRGFAVVDFHIDIGFVVEDCYPLGVFSKEELTALSFMSFPDCNSSLLGDYVYSFRFPLHRYLSQEGPPLDGFQYGYTLFRQTKDASRGRGYFQKAIVLITHQPFTQLFTDVIRLVAPLYFECGKEVLEAASHNIALWPAPIPGEVFELPILGSVFLLQVPYEYLPTDIHDYVLSNASSTAPPPSDSSSNSTAYLSPNSRAIQRIAAEQSQRNRRLSYVRQVMMPPGSPEQGSSSNISHGGGSTMHASSTYARDRTASVVSSSLFFTAVADPSATPTHVRPPGMLTPRAPSTSPHHRGREHLPRHISVDMSSPLRRMSEEEPRSRDSGKRGSAPLSPQQKAGSSLRPRSASTSPARVQPWQPVQSVPRYYFEDINTYQAVGPRLLPHMWTLWELLLTGQPVIVKSTVPSAASNFVLALVGLICPLTYRGDYRPYFTVNDPVFNKYSARKVPDLPPVVLGVTNPIFLKIFSHWPTIVKVGDPMASRENESKMSRERRASILVKHKQEMVTSYKPTVPQNKALLKKLSPRQDDRMNNQIIRRHFMQLTESFLGAFSRYFEWNITPRPDNVWFVAPHPRLPSFDEEVFIAELAAYHAQTGKITSLNVSKGASLYRAFIRSVNFKPWFQARRQESLGHYANLCRHLKFESDVGSLIGTLDEVRQVDLAMKIRDALERENALPSPDPAIVDKLHSDLSLAISVLPTELHASLRLSLPSQ